MRSILGLQVPRPEPSPLMKISEIANTLQRLRTQAAQRQQVQQATQLAAQKEPLQEQLLQAQAFKAHQQALHPEAALTGPAAQIQYAYQFPPGDPRRELVLEGLRQQTGLRGARTARYQQLAIPQATREQMEINLAKANYPAELRAEMSLEDKQRALQNNWTPEEYTRQKHIMASPDHKQAQKQYYELQSKMDKQTHSAGQLKMVPAINNVLGQIEALRALGHQFSQYFQGIGQGKLGRDRLRSLFGTNTAAFNAYQRYMKRVIPFISEYKTATGGPTSIQEIQLLKQAVPTDFWNMSPELFDQIYNDMRDNMLSHRGEVNKTIAQGLRPEPHALAQTRAARQNSALPVHIPKFNNRAEALAWYRKMKAQRNPIADQLYKYAR